MHPAFSVWSYGRREDSGTDPEDRAEHPVTQPAEIAPKTLPGLFIGDLDDVADVGKLSALGIGFVLNLCPERLTGRYADIPLQLAVANIKHLAWPADDDPNFNILGEVIHCGALEFVQNGFRVAGVLINCWGGVNRSGAVAVAYLALKSNYSLVCAVRQVMSQRGTVLTNKAFRLQLAEAVFAAGLPLQTPSHRLSLLSPLAG